MIFKSLFGKRKPRMISNAKVGPLIFCNDDKESYWETQANVLFGLPNFGFGAISGSELGPKKENVDAFAELIFNPDLIYSLIKDEFFDIAKPEHNLKNKKDVMSQFDLTSLTLTSPKSYEFGLHSKTHDIFIESFVRKGVVTEIYKDFGCCDSN